MTLEATVPQPVTQDPAAQAPSADSGQTLAPQSFTASLQEYAKESPWAAEYLKLPNPENQVLKDFANAQKLLGSRPNIPNENSTPEERKAFYKTIGVPDDITGYKLEPVQWSEEQKAAASVLDASRNEAFMNKLFAVALEEGIPAKAMNRLAQAYDMGFVEQHAASLAEVARVEAEQAADFDTKADRLFGANKEKALTNGAALLKSAPPEIAQLLASHQNEPLIGVAALLNWVHETYIKEAPPINGKNVTAGGGYTEADVRAEAQAFRRENKKALDDFQDAGHEAAKAGLKAIYEKLKRA